MVIHQPRTDIDRLIRFQHNIMNNDLVKYCDASNPLWKENVASFHNASNVTGRFTSCCDMLPLAFSLAIVLLFPLRNSDSSSQGKRCDICCSLYNAVIALLYPPIVDTALYVILSSFYTFFIFDLTVTINVDVATIAYVSKKL